MSHVLHSGRTETVPFKTDSDVQGANQLASNEMGKSLIQEGYPTIHGQLHKP